jgi:hypothetical protein
MKILTLFIALLISSCSPKLDTPISRAITMNKELDLYILGERSYNVVVSRVWFYPKTLSYKVSGYVNDINLYDMQNPIIIDVVRDGKAIQHSKTRKWGKFDLHIKPNDTIVIQGDRPKIIVIDNRVEG